MENERDYLLQQIQQWEHEYKELKGEKEDLAQQLVTCRRTIKRMRKAISKPSDTDDIEILNSHLSHLDKLLDSGTKLERPKSIDLLAESLSKSDDTETKENKSYKKFLGKMKDNELTIVEKFTIEEPKQENMVTVPSSNKQVSPHERAMGTPKETKQ